jgi:hypothetical protein
MLYQYSARIKSTFEKIKYFLENGLTKQKRAIIFAALLHD